MTYCAHTHICGKLVPNIGWWTYRFLLSVILHVENSIEAPTSPGMIQRRDGPCFDARCSCPEALEPRGCRVGSSDCFRHKISSL